MAKSLRAARHRRSVQTLRPAADEDNELVHNADADMLMESNAQDSVDEDELGVYDIEAEDDESEDSGDEAAGTRLSKLLREERAVRAKLQLQEGEEDLSVDLAEPEEKSRKWGAKRNVYYDNSEQELEGEDLEQEEEEALAQQRQKAEALDRTDYGAESSGDGDTDAEVEEEPKLTETTVSPDTPVLGALLEGLEASLGEVRSRIGPLLMEVRAGSLATTEGVSYLEIKNMLLLQYCLHLLFYLLLKAEGRSVESHPVVTKLVEIRAFMEKIRPLDKKLRYQIEKLLTSRQFIQASTAGSAEADPAQYRPLPDALIPKVAAAAETSPDGPEQAYRPPRLMPLAMQDDPDGEHSRLGKRAAGNKARKSLRSSLIKDLAREVHDMPDEVRQARVGDDRARIVNQRERLAKRAAEEEDLMMRVPLTREEVKGLKAVNRAHLQGGALLDDFADDVADLIQASSQMPGSASQKFGVDLMQRPARGADQSGDADLPPKLSLAERRNHVDNVRTQQLRQLTPENDLTAKRPPQVELHEAEEYITAKRRAQDKRTAKDAKYSTASLHPPLADEQAEGHRKISRAVERNRGLTPHRSKETKNPRVKARKKFNAATMRRKGQVAELRKPSGPYGGEETGIRSRVSKSRRL